MWYVTWMFLFTCLTSVVKSENKPSKIDDEWNYWGVHNERYWEKAYRSCRGRHQSPINIERRHLVYQADMQLEFVNYDLSIKDMVLTNTGHGVQLAPPVPNNLPAFVSGTAVGGETYRFLQLHWHWRNAHSSGSEHAIDKEKFSMEVNKFRENRII